MGKIPNNAVRIRGRLSDKNSFNFAVYTITTPITIRGTWNPVCIDLYESLEKVFDETARSFRVYRIYFESSPGSEDFWIDEVYISDEKPTS